MEMIIIFKALFSLVIVLVVLYVLLKLIQRYSRFGNLSKNPRKANNLKVENIVYIDVNMKIVNISDKRGNNYILAVGRNNSFLIDKYKIDEEAQGNE